MRMLQPKIVRRIDTMALIATAVWIIVRSLSLYAFPVSTILLIIPIAAASAAVGINLKIKPDKRVSAYRLVYKMYWHPICSLLTAVSLAFLDLPTHRILFRFLNVTGAIMVFAVMLWSLGRWIQSMR